MIERVARAMRDELGLDWPYKGHKSLMDTARAAIEAMREPSAEMITAGIIERHDAGTPEAWSLATASIYRAMVDEALNAHHT